MEHHVQSVDDALIGGLSFKLKPGASYVTADRFHILLQGVILSVKVVKSNFTGDQWLDPSIFRVMFQLNNNNGNNGAGVPIMVQLSSCNPAVFFRRARLICGGQVVEGIDSFTRLSLMLIDLLPEDDQFDIACEGLGINFVQGEAAQAADQRKGYRQTDYDLSGNVTVCSSSCLVQTNDALFNQEQLIPLRCCPIQIELDLVNSPAGAVSFEVAAGFSNRSAWDISDIQCKCDLLTLDNGLDNEYASHLLSGKSLPINSEIQILATIRTNRLVTIKTSWLILLVL